MQNQVYESNAILLLCTTTNLTFNKLLQHRAKHAAHAGKIAPVPLRVFASVSGASATARCVCVCPLVFIECMFILTRMYVHPNSSEVRM
jgi:hypothetical protein